MIIKTGCDIVKIERFSKNIENIEVIKKVFTTYEITNTKNIESLAGIFAAKESIIKALQFGFNNWTCIEIMKEENGKPIAKLHGYDKDIISYDISISHDGDYAFATSCFLINDIK